MICFPAMATQVSRRSGVRRRGSPVQARKRVHESLRSLAARLHHKLGSSAYREILETIDRETTAQQSAAPAFRDAQAANAVRLATLRARVLEHALSSDEVRSFVGRSRPTINKMAKDGLLLAVPDGRSLRFPRWQFDAQTKDGLIPGLHAVLAVVDASQFRTAAWFVSHNPALDGDTPADVLRRGNIERIVEEAKTLVGS